MHPLVPAQSLTFHVEGSNGKSIFHRGLMVVKELVYFEYPAHCISAIKSGYIEFHTRGGGFGDGGGEGGGGGDGVVESMASWLRMVSTFSDNSSSHSEFMGAMERE
jgi:hypothetical protein